MTTNTQTPARAFRSDLVSETTYVDYPKVTVNTPIGPVTLAVTSGGHIHAHTDAHLNDDAPCVTFKGREFLVGINFFAENGWAPKSSEYIHVSRRDTWGAATAYQTREITKILAAFVQKWVNDNPEVLRAAYVAETANALADVRKRKSELIAELNVVMGSEHGLATVLDSI